MNNPSLALKFKRAYTVERVCLSGSAFNILLILFVCIELHRLL